MGTATYAKSISGVLAEGDAAFDPWNQERWADWYENGQIVEPFDIDRSVTFAPRDTPWRFSTEQFQEKNGETSEIFRVIGDNPVVVDGNGITIDVIKPKYYDWSIAAFYRTKDHPRDMVYHIDGFKFQHDKPGSEPSVLRNITLMGFWRAVENSHASRRPVVWEDLTVARNICGLYPAKGYGIVRRCNVIENMFIGMYVDTDAHDWVIEGNVFRDNNFYGARSWAAITLDACYSNIVRNNQFQGPTQTPPAYNVAISLYRNRGELYELREHPAMFNLIEDNTFTNYSMAIDVGVRAGNIPGGIQVDLSKESRVYVLYNTIRDNTFTDCRIGMLLRTGANRIDGNTFNNVERPIVINNVFYSVAQNVILNQPDLPVSLWSDREDYGGYARHMAFFHGVGRYIPTSEKLYHVVAPGVPPAFENPGEAMLIVADPLVEIPTDPASTNYNNFEISLDRAESLGFTNKPIGLATARFGDDHETSDYAVIFEQPSSQILEDKYYSIFLCDYNGVEFDRSGRSTKRWSVIAAGDLLRDSGSRMHGSNAEIAAASSEPDENGCYPVYVFCRSWADPEVVLLKDNKIPVIGLAVGDFKTDGDEYQELAVLLADDSVIHLFKPSDESWSAEVQTEIDELAAIACGEFNGNASDGDELVAITAYPGPVWLFKQGQSGPYDAVGDDDEWSLLAAGTLADGTDAIAVAQTHGDGFEVQVLHPDGTKPVYTLESPVPGGLPVAIAVGRYAPALEGPGLVLDGLPAPSQIISGVAILPQTAPESVPVLVWCPVGSDTSGQARVVGILK